MAKGKTAKGVKLLIGPLRFCYANVHEARQINGLGDPKFSCVGLIDKKKAAASIKEIEKAIKEAYDEGVKSIWGGKEPSKKDFKWPLHDGDEERPDAEEYAGMMFVNASNKQRPGILVRKDGNNFPLENLEDMYSGAYGFMTVSFFAFDNLSKGIGCSLQNILKTKDGEKLSSRASAESDFADFKDGDEDMM